MAVFILHRLEPHPAGIGKPLYFLFDAGLAFHLGASYEKRLTIWAINECLSQHEYFGLSRPKICYYESSHHSFVDIIIKEKKGGTKAYLFTDEVSPKSYQLRTANAFLKLVPNAHFTILAPTNEVYRENEKIVSIPWTMMA